MIISATLNADSVRRRISELNWDTREIENPIRIEGPITNRDVEGEVHLGKVHEQMIEQIKNGADRIELLIDTPGGAYDPISQSLLSFMDLAQKHNVVIACTVTGRAASMGAVLLSHCHERYMVATSFLLVHSVQIQTGRRINANNINDLVGTIKELNARIWASTIELFNNIEYFNENFVAERYIPAAEIAERCPDMAQLVLGYKIVESD